MRTLKFISDSSVKRVDTLSSCNFNWEKHAWYYLVNCECLYFSFYIGSRFHKLQSLQMTLKTVFPLSGFRNGDLCDRRAVTKYNRTGWHFKIYCHYVIVHIRFLANCVADNFLFLPKWIHPDDLFFHFACLTKSSEF